MISLNDDEKDSMKYEFKKIRAGEFASINSKSARGHKGLIGKRKKNGEIIAITTTHHMYTRGVKNILLQVNPQKDDSRKSYVNKRVHIVTDRNIGKRHSKMVVVNSSDKSIFRKLKTISKKRQASRNLIRP